MKQINNNYQHIRQDMCNCVNNNNLKDKRVCFIGVKDGKIIIGPPKFTHLCGKSCNHHLCNHH